MSVLVDTSVTKSVAGALVNNDSSITVANNPNRTLVCIINGWDQVPNFGSHTCSLDGGPTSDWTRAGVGVRSTDESNNSIWVYTGGQPSVGAHTVRVNGGNLNAGEITIVSIYNNDQTTRYRTAFAGSSSTNAPSLTVTNSVAGDLVIGSVCADDTNTSAFVVGAGQTAFQNGHPNVGEWTVSDWETATGANTITSWAITRASGTSVPSYLAMAFIEASGGGGVTGTANGHSGAEGTDSGIPGHSAGALSSDGAKGVDVGVKAATKGALSSDGAKGVDVGAKAASGASLSKDGAEGQDVGASARSSAVVGSAGASGQCSGLQGGAKFATGHAGARGQCVGSKGGSSSPLARAGARAQAAGASSPSLSGTSVGRAGAKGQCAGTPRFANVAAGRAGLRGVNVPQSNRTNETEGTAGGSGQSVKGGGPAPEPEPTANDRTCEADYSLDAIVVWPPGVDHGTGEETAAELRGCAVPTDVLMPWEI